MNRRSFLKLAGICSVSVMGTTLSGCVENVSVQDSGNRFAARGSERPNFLFLFTDDQSFNTVDALNNTQVKTPNIDRLVRKGVTFTHCFNQGAWGGAICIASRAMLNTGRYLRDCGGNECGNYPLWGRVLGDAGYDTFMTGKWHNGDNALKRSFKEFGPIGGGMLHSKDPNAKENKKKGIVNDPYDRPRQGNSWSPYDKSLKGHWLDKDGRKVHSNKVYADAAIDNIENAAGKSNDPFFMYVSFNAPHDPRQAPKEFVDMYPPDKIEIPPNYLPEHPFDQGDNRLRDEKLAPFPRTKEAVAVHLSEYYAIVSHTDHQIGRILDALDKSGKADNTIVIFSSDHGLAVGQHGLMGKQNQYDHSVRMPFVIGGPGIAKNVRNDAMIYLQSCFATTCEMANIEAPETLQFPSLVPLLTGEKKKLYDSIYGSYRHLQRMLRTDRYKLIRYPHNGEVQLFDIKKDPWEMKDLAEDAKYKNVLKSLDEKLKRWMTETSDPLGRDFAGVL
ncbi:MAG: sulfatase-like hydrolase/transferase [Planctomycetes bacterium]|nr:sulfatase-like hydrolase/transferase [Planctomycetota bacterium]